VFLYISFAFKMKLKALNIGFTQDFFGLFYPNLCGACGYKLIRQENVICTSCLIDMPRTGYTLDKENPVSLVFAGRVDIVGASSFFHFRKASKYQSLLHQLKYRGRKDIGIELGRQFGFELLNCLKNIDLIIPIPLHPKRLKKRGYNQSEMIARGISEVSGIIIDNNSVKRNVATATQTKKTRMERWENVENIFIVTNADMLKNKHILLVDDVITTGATIEACASAILNIPSVKVSIATLALA